MNVNQRITGHSCFKNECLESKLKRVLLKSCRICRETYRAFFQNWDLLINFSLPFSPPHQHHHQSWGMQGMWREINRGMPVALMIPANNFPTTTICYQTAFSYYLTWHKAPSSQYHEVDEHRPLAAFN